MGTLDRLGSKDEVLAGEMYQLANTALRALENLDTFYWPYLPKVSLDADIAVVEWYYRQYISASR